MHPTVWEEYPLSSVQTAIFLDVFNIMQTATVDVEFITENRLPKVGKILPEGKGSCGCQNVNKLVNKKL